MSNSRNAEVRHDYVYSVFNPLAPQNSPCEKQCGFLYKTSLPEHVFSPICAKCGTKMAFKVARRETSEKQYALGNE